MLSDIPTYPFHLYIYYGRIDPLKQLGWPTPTCQFCELNDWFWLKAEQWSGHVIMNKIAVTSQFSNGHLGSSKDCLDLAMPLYCALYSLEVLCIKQ